MSDFLIFTGIPALVTLITAYGMYRWVSHQR